MKPDELMIGDIVYNSYRGKYVRWDYTEMFYHGRPIEGRDLEPVPLTREILEKLGFKLDVAEYPCGSFYKFPKEYKDIVRRGFGIEIHDDVFFITDHALMPIRYVHEFQHTLRLAGLKELADKFKIEHPSDEWVDLGLSSGTRWKNTAEKGYYTYGQAMAKFGGKLPVNQQWKELMTECQWEWTGNGFKVTGSNGNSIYLPEAGFRQDDSNVLNIGGYYWSSTLDSEGFAWYLGFYSGGFAINRSFRCYGQSVILVDNQN